jgi:thiol:disulfide interchange protein
MFGLTCSTLETKKLLLYAAASVAMGTFLQRKNMSNFRTWSQENLAEFAHQANEKMIQQNDRIEQLQRDVKDALQAYRDLLRKWPSA